MSRSMHLAWAALTLVGCAGGSGTNPGPFDGGAGAKDGPAAKTADGSTEPVAKVETSGRRGDPFKKSEKAIATAKRAEVGSAPVESDRWTFRLRTYAGREHKTQAEQGLAETRRRGLVGAFTVDRGDESVLCYGDYPAPEYREGSPSLHENVLADKQKLTELFKDEVERGGSYRPEYRPRPMPTTENKYSIATARHEWTLHCFSEYGYANAKEVAMSLAEGIRSQYKLSAFVVKDLDQYMVCVGDLPDDAVKLEILRNVNSDNTDPDRITKDSEGRRFGFQSRDGRLLSKNLDRRAIEVTDDAKEIFERFKVFGANGKQSFWPKNLSNGRDIPVLSGWLRISEIRGAVQRDVDDIDSVLRRGR